MKGARRIMYTSLAAELVFIWALVLSGHPLVAVFQGLGYATGCATVGAAVYWARSENWR